MQVFNNKGVLITDIFYLDDVKLPNDFIKDFTFVATKSYKYLPLFSHIYSRTTDEVHIVTLYDILSESIIDYKSLLGDFKISRAQYEDMLSLVEDEKSSKSLGIIKKIESLIPNFQKNINNYLGVTAVKKSSDDWSKGSTPVAVSPKGPVVSPVKLDKGKGPVVSPVKIDKGKGPAVYESDDDISSESEEEEDDEIEAMMKRLGVVATPTSPVKVTVPSFLFSESILSYNVTLSSPLENYVPLRDIYNYLKDHVTNMALSLDGEDMMTGKITIKSQKDYNIYFDYKNIRTRISQFGGVFSKVKTFIKPNEIQDDLLKNKESLDYIFELLSRVMPLKEREHRPYNFTARFTYPGSIGPKVYSTFKLKSSRFSTDINGVKKQIYYSLVKGRDTYTTNIQSIELFPATLKVINFPYIEAKVEVPEVQPKRDIEVLKSLIPVDARICQKPRQVSIRTNEDNFMKLDSGIEVVCKSKEYPYPGMTKNKGIPCCFKKERKQAVTRRFNYTDTEKGKFSKVYAKPNIAFGRHVLTGKIKSILSPEYSIFSVSSEASLNDAISFFDATPESVLVIEPSLAVDLNYGTGDEVMIIVKYNNNHKVLVREENKNLIFIHNNKWADIKKLYPGKTTGQSYCRGGKVFFKQTEDGLIPVLPVPCVDGLDIEMMQIPSQEEALNTLTKQGIVFDSVTMSNSLVTSIKCGVLNLPVKKEPLRLDLEVSSSKFYIEILGVTPDLKVPRSFDIPRTILPLVKTRNYENILKKVEETVSDKDLSHTLTMRLINEQDRFFS